MHLSTTGICRLAAALHAPLESRGPECDHWCASRIYVKPSSPLWLRDSIKGWLMATQVIDVTRQWTEAWFCVLFDVCLLIINHKIRCTANFGQLRAVRVILIVSRPIPWSEQHVGFIIERSSPVGIVAETFNHVSRYAIGIDISLCWRNHVFQRTSIKEQWLCRHLLR